MTIFEMALLYIVGQMLHASTLYWVIYAVWIIGTIFKALIDNAPEMEDE